MLYILFDLKMYICKILASRSVDFCLLKFLTNKPKFANKLKYPRRRQACVFTAVPLFRAEVVCWIFSLGSFLCFLSRDRSGGQGSVLLKSAATWLTQHSAQPSLTDSGLIHSVLPLKSTQIQASDDFRIVLNTINISFKYESADISNMSPKL